MALSQIQCLDENHVNPRTHESKPEFLYCEDQRLALEALLRDGREAFTKHLEARGLRGFLSDLELETFLGAVEPYDPDSDLFPVNAEDDEPPLSLHYWPELSDTSVPQLDLGWPDSESYRGVTRTTVYTQPPLDGQAHIKEVVRKMIAQAQKVIAVVMDVFTDVDIFRDLLDAGFKRRVAVYILLERTTLPHFMSMCQRANMHAGHLKHLRVRCTDGAEFYTRSSTKVKGRMGHRFMFVDGDKAVSGSYNFTWMSSRLDRNLITVVTGQAVDAFDRLFRHLYVTSSSVDLRQIATEPEPEPEPLPQPAAVVPPSAALARKLYNPKYALLTIGNPSQTSTPSADPSSSKEPLNLENSKNPDVPETDKRRKKRASKEAIEVPPLHPGLIDLEKACLISYLPTWPEPDPPSDVIGFINIRDSSKPTQVHMQRSEMFETSQAIRFSSPLSMPKETLPEVAKPRQFTAKCDEVKKLQPMGDKTKAGESLVDSVQPTQLTPQPDDIKCKKEGHEQEPSSGQKSEPTKDTTEAHRITTKNKLLSSTPLVQDAGSNTTPHLIAHTPARSSSTKVSTPNSHGSSDSTQTVTTNSPKSESLPELTTQNKAETTLNTQRHETQTLESNSTQSPHLHAPAESNSEQCTQEPTGLPPTNSHTQQQSSSEMTPVVHSHISTASASETNSPSTSVTTNVCTPLSSTLASPVLPPLTSPSAMLDLTHASSTTSPPPPIPKPRTIHLVIKGTNEDLPEISVDRTDCLASMGQLAVHSKPEVATVAQTPPEKEPETVLELHTSKMGKQKDTENTGTPEEAPQQEQTVASKETKGKGAVALDDTAAETQAQSAVLIPDAPKAGGVHIQEMIPEEINPSTNGKITSKTQTDQTKVTDTKTLEKALTNCELAQTLSEKSNNVTHIARGHETQKLSHCETNPPSNGALDTVKCLNASTHSPFSTTANSHTSTDSADDGTSGQRSNPSATPPPHMDSKPHMSKDNAHIHAAYQESQRAFKPRGSSHTPERPLRLHLSDTHIRDLRSQTSEQELCSLTALIRAPSSEWLPPDSRTHTPDPRSYTPDLQSPTPDVGEGYVSPRDSSTVSTTSEEYYECCESPFRDPVFDSAGYRKNGTPEDHVTFTHTNTPNAATITASFVSPADVNHNTHPADKNSSCSETQTIMRREEHTASEENEKEKNVAERRTEQGSQEIERRGNKEAKKTAEHLVRGIDLTEVVGKDKESKPQAPKRKRPLNKSANESLVDGGAALGNSTKEGTDTKRLSTCGLKPDKVSADGERPDKETVVDKAALTASGMEKRDRPQSTRDTDGQKPFRGQQQQQQQQQQQPGGGSSSPTRPPRPPRPISATQPLGTRLCESHQLNQAESKDLHGSFQVLDNTSSPRRPPSRPPPPLVLGASGSAGGQKQAKISHSQNNLPSQQHPAAQSRVRVGQSPSQHPYLKPHSSLLLTQSNIQPQPHPRSQNQSVSIREAHRQEEARAPFTITFGRLYSLKGLRDKMSRLPAQSKRSGKRGGTSSPVQGRKSTS